MFKLSLGWLLSEIGLTALFQSDRNVFIIIAQRCLRMLGFGLTNLVLALYFHELGLSDSQMGFFFSCTLWGDVLLSLFFTAFADRMGRRNVLMVGSAAMVFSGVTFSLTRNYWALLIAAVFGVISISGGEIGPFRAVEESIISELTTEVTRTYVLTWYVVTAAFGTATGAGLSGFVVTCLEDGLQWNKTEAYQSIFWLYALVGIFNIGLSFMLGKQCERQIIMAKDSTIEAVELEDMLSSDDDDEEDRESAPAMRSTSSSPKSSILPQISRSTLTILSRLCLIMAIDSFASGMVPFSLINYYLDTKFHLPTDKLGSIMSVAWLCSAASNIFAGSIAKRIGLIKTMVFTHLPSAITLTMLPLPSSAGWTVALLFIRASLGSMDQAPKSAFIAAIVKPEERTTVMGFVNAMKIVAQSAGPWTTGGLAAQGSFWVAFVVAGSLKATYDILLLVMFLGTKTQEQKNIEGNAGGRYEAVADRDQDEAHTECNRRPVSDGSRGD